MSGSGQADFAGDWFAPQAIAPRTIGVAGQARDWRPHPRVNARVTTRRGNLSPPPWQGFNLGLNCDDERERVLNAREQVNAAIGMNAPAWLTQVHGNRVVTAPCAQALVEADGVVTSDVGLPCAVLTADCLPVLIAREDGSAVGALHAGWRGLLDGVLENGVAALPGTTADVHAWLGPAICCRCYQVDDSVREGFVGRSADAAAGFVEDGVGRWRMDLSVLARQRLLAVGVKSISGGDLCTHCRADLFYSFRHEGKTGRFATIIWLED